MPTRNAKRKSGSNAVTLATVQEWWEEDEAQPAEINRAIIAGRSCPLPSNLDASQLHPLELAQVLRKEADRLSSDIDAWGFGDRCGVGCHFAGKAAGVACFAWEWIARHLTGFTYNPPGTEAEPAKPWHRLDAFTSWAIHLSGSHGPIPGTPLGAIRWPWAMRTVAEWLDDTTTAERAEAKAGMIAPDTVASANNGGNAKADPGPKAEPVLEEIDVKILKALAAYNHTVKLADLAMRVEHDRNTCAGLVNKLIQEGYAARKSERSGVAITDAGRARIPPDTKPT